LVHQIDLDELLFVVRLVYAYCINPYWLGSHSAVLPSLCEVWEGRIEVLVDVKPMSIAADGERIGLRTPCVGQSIEVEFRIEADVFKGPAEAVVCVRCIGDQEAHLTSHERLINKSG
jgi:hypothetical protein